MCSGGTSRLCAKQAAPLWRDEPPATAILPYCHTAIAVSAPSNRLHSVGRRPDLGCSRTVDCPHRHRDRHSGLWSGVIRQSLARSATGKTKCVNEAERAEAGRGREMQSIHASELTLAACYSCTSDGKAVQVRGGEGGGGRHRTSHTSKRKREPHAQESLHTVRTRYVPSWPIRQLTPSCPVVCLADCLSVCLSVVCPPNRHAASMANLTTAFDALLKGNEAPPTRPFGLDTADEFLKEAYRIVRSSVVLALALRRRPMPN